MIRNWLALAIITLLTILFLLLWDSPPAGLMAPEPVPADTTLHPANILHNAVNRRYNPDGSLHSELRASESRYFQVNPRQRSGKDYMEMTRPDMTLYSDDKPPWQITAREGITRDNGNRIELWGDVHIWQTDELGQRSELNTEYLVLEPEQQYAETDKPVIIVSPGNTTRAIGMKAFLQRDIIKLLSNVRGIHEPQ